MSTYSIVIRALNLYVRDNHFVTGDKPVSTIDVPRDRKAGGISQAYPKTWIVCAKMAEI